MDMEGAIQFNDHRNAIVAFFGALDCARDRRHLISGVLPYGAVWKR